MRRLIVVAVLAASLGAADAARASCAPEYTDDELRVVDGAFVGTVEAVRSEANGSQTTFTFRVERVFKGEFGERVDVRDQYGLSSVSLRAEVGDRLALMVERSDGAWVSTECRRTSEEALADATRRPCRSSGRPARAYRRKPRASGLRYLTAPRVVGCGRTGGRHFQLIAARMKPDDGPSRVIIDVLIPRERMGFCCGRPRPARGEDVEARLQAGSETGRRLLAGATSGLVDAVRVEYRLGGEPPVRRAAAHVHVDDARVLRGLRLRRPFGFYVAALPPDAGATRVTALAWDGAELGTADSPFD